MFVLDYGGGGAVFEWGLNLSPCCGSRNSKLAWALTTPCLPPTASPLHSGRLSQLWTGSQESSGWWSFSVAPQLSQCESWAHICARSSAWSAGDKGARSESQTYLKTTKQVLQLLEEKVRSRQQTVLCRGAGEGSASGLLCWALGFSTFSTSSRSWSGGGM